jgi:O-antigen/teichoic acid export membrane protein
LTFILFFLYPSYSSRQIDPILFQMTLLLMVFTIFSFGFSGLYYYGIIRNPAITPAMSRSYHRKGERFFVLGLLLGLAVPALIFFTIGLILIGIVATVLWLVYSYSVVQHARKGEVLRN